MKVTLLALLTYTIAHIGYCWKEWNWKTDSPGPRAGHSFLLWDRKVFVFGGRSGDVQVSHDPKTYEIQNSAGVLEFSYYDRRSVIVCSDLEPDCKDITIGKYHNDLWEYDLSAWMESRFVTGYNILQISRRLPAC